MKNLRLLALALSLPIAAFCQDITGLWAGTMHNDSTGLDYQYEIGITKNNGKYTGFSHTWFDIDGKQYYGVKKLKIRIANDGKIVILDDELVSSNYPVAVNKDIRQLNILNFQEGTTPLMNGPFVTNRTKEYMPLTGHVSIAKKQDIMNSNLVPHLKEISHNVDWSFLTASHEPVAKNAKK